MVWECLEEVVGVPFGFLGSLWAPIWVLWPALAASGASWVPSADLWNVFGMLWGCVGVPLGASGMPLGCLFGPSESELQLFRFDWV